MSTYCSKTGFDFLQRKKHPSRCSLVVKMPESEEKHRLTILTVVGLLLNDVVLGHRLGYTFHTGP
jgi:hypothetical protein